MIVMNIISKDVYFLYAVHGNLESGDVNVGLIVGVVLGGIVLVIIAIVLVGAVAFLLYPRGNKEKQYITFARFRRDTGAYE